MYDHNSFVIVTLLFVALLLAVEAGYRLGGNLEAHASKASKSQISAIQASLLGVLALLLGFTFSLSLQRFDSRSQAVVAEANAIGTALLRADLLPESSDPQIRRGIRRYIELRIIAGTISLDRHEDREDILAATAAIQTDLWSLAAKAAAEDPSPVRTGLFIQALNDAIDAYGERNAALNRHVPELVLFLLFGTFALTACLVGYSSGIARHRTTFPTYILMLLITFLVFIIIDLDRPRRGLIEVSQQSMLALDAASDS